MRRCSDGRPSERDQWHGVPLGEILHRPHQRAQRERARAGRGGRPGAGAARAGSQAGRRARGFPQFRPQRQLHGRARAAAGRGGVLEVARRRRRRGSATTIPRPATSLPIGWPNASSAASIDGHLLCPGGLLPADEYGSPQNDFGFIRTDPHGRGCPMGSHVRRANPRDGLAQERGLGADPARRRQQPPHPASRPQIRHDDRRSACRTTTRIGDCSSSA